MRSLQGVVLALVVGIGVISTVVMSYFVQQATTSFVSRAEYQHAQDLLSTVYLGVESEYEGLLYYKQATLDRRKVELRNIVSLGLSIVKKHYDDAKAGRMTEEQAKSAALEGLRSLRYHNDTGYVWVNNTDLPIPRIIMHPIFPEIERRLAVDTRFTMALDDGENLLARFVEITQSEGEGYIDYRWPRPGVASGSEAERKTSYVILFKEWGWVLGSGVYIDDIDDEVEKRKQAIAAEVRKTFSQVKIAETGYMFLFSGDESFVLHPEYAGKPTKELCNPDTGVPVMTELKAAAENGNMWEYRWDKPPHEVGNFTFWKRTYVRHFAPLDWYIAASMYRDEIEAPGREIRNTIGQISLAFLLLALICGAFLVRRITRPLVRLTNSAREIDENSLHSAEIPVGGTREVRQLGLVLRKMLQSVSNGVREKEALLGTLTEYRNYLQDILDSMPSELISVDSSGHVRQWNHIAEQKTGVSPTEASGKPLQDVYPWLAQEMAAACKPSAVCGPVERNKIPREENDETVFSNITAYPLQSVGDVVIRVDDVTTMAHIEDMMMQTEKMLSLGGLAAGMAHEINNPLAGIMQSAQNINRRLSLENKANRRAAEEKGVSLEQVHDYMEDRKILTMLKGITSSAERAAIIVTNMLEFSRKSDHKKTTCSLVDLVEKTISLASSDYDLKKNYDFRKVTVVRDFAAEIPPVSCVETEIEQVLLNLFRNAAQAMAEQEGRTEPEVLTVRMKTEGRLVQIDVQDNGPGMDEEHRKRIFEPFFTTKPKGVGTGLGLSVSFFIITQNHSGTFHVESEPGVGTTFVIRLPVVRGEKNAE